MLILSTLIDDRRDVMSTQTLQPHQPREIISYDPASGQEIGRAPLADATDVRNAVKRARAGQPEWARLSFRERASVILHARELVLAQVDEISTLSSRSTRKPPHAAISMQAVLT